MMPGTRVRPAFVGPHEDRELDLMKTGIKPLAMFVEPLEPEFEYFPETSFDEMVAQGRLVKRTRIENLNGPSGRPESIRRVLYALPHEIWRIDAILFLQDLYDSRPPGRHLDLDRAIGLLLGYDRSDIERYLIWLSERQSTPTAN